MNESIDYRIKWKTVYFEAILRTQTVGGGGLNMNKKN